MFTSIEFEFGIIAKCLWLCVDCIPPPMYFLLKSEEKKTVYFSRLYTRTHYSSNASMMMIARTKTLPFIRNSLYCFGGRPRAFFRGIGMAWNLHKIWTRINFNRSITPRLLFSVREGIWSPLYSHTDMHKTWRWLFDMATVTERINRTNTQSRKKAERMATLWTFSRNQYYADEFEF